MKLKDFFNRTRFISDKAEPKNYLKVFLINQPKKGVPIAEALGISPERKKELMGYAISLSNDNLFFSESLAKLSEKCVHANELAFIGFYLGGMSYQNNNPLAFFTNQFNK